ncbi:hypothetical protein [Lysobacter gummosus]|uniref:hypothetical protein n=1 Tax=Lysobacter gummosus TaxID=262324 RepID=UPI003633B865
MRRSEERVLAFAHSSLLRTRSWPLTPSAPHPRYNLSARTGRIRFGSCPCA